MKTIFVVEEDDSSRNLLWELLTQRKDHTVHLLKDVVAANRALEELERPPDLLVTDIELSGDGENPFFADFRSRFPSSDIITFSRKPDSALVRSALDQGVAFVLSRPVDVTVFLDKVRYIMGRRESRAPVVDGVQPDVVKEDWLELTAPSDMEYVERFRHFTDILYQTNLSSAVKRDLKIAINELGQNAVEWGNRGDSEKSIHLLYSVFDDRIMLKIEDEGEGFDTEKLSNPTEEPLEFQRKRETQGKRVGGYGIFIVKNLMDQVIYNTRGNIVIMTKFLPPSPVPDDGGKNK